MDSSVLNTNEGSFNDLFFQIRTKSPHRKCAIRYDKLYIDNVPYVYDESRGTVVRHYPQEPLRSGSRTNYSSLGNYMINFM